jgi:predicted nuclease of restriction endonuclease-like (RecB) superfamily
MTENEYLEIKMCIEQARLSIVKSVNYVMVITHWEIGKRIVEAEQNGQQRAEYGKFLIKNLAQRLIQAFGKGFEERELRKMRQFYLYFPIRDALRPELSWTHYRLLLRVGAEAARSFYMVESIAGSWTSRQLERQMNACFYERLTAVADKKAVTTTALVSEAAPKPTDFFKDPFVLEFLNIEDKNNYQEYDLENAILAQLETFMLELGKGFCFVARQQRITTDAGKHYKIDLVFYNYLLKCFLLIDLKIGTLTPQDVGQMDMYVRLYEELKKPKGDNPTIGLVLCSERDDTVVKYSVLNGSEHLFAGQYQFYLPTQEQLSFWVQSQRQFLELKKEDIASEDT